MKKFCFVTVLLVFVSVFTLASAVSAEEKNGAEFCISLAYYSQYVSPFGSTLFNKEVVQADVGIVHSSGFHLDVWGSYSPSEGWNSDFGDEADLIVGFKKELKAVEVDLSASYYDLLKVGTFDEEDVYALTLSVSAPEVFLGITPFVIVEADAIFHEEGGVLYQIGLERRFWKAIGTSVSASGHSDIYGIEAETVGSAHASLSVTIPIGKLEITPEVHYQLGFGGEEGMAEKELFWWGIGASLTF